MGNMRLYFEKIYTEGFSSFMEELKHKLVNNEKAFIITANPETLMIGQESKEFDKVLKSKDTIITPDGIGVVKAAKTLGYPVKERVTGVEIVTGLFDILNEKKGTIYFLGAKQNVIEKLVNNVTEKYSSINILGYENGYVKDKDAVFDNIAQLKPDVVLVALGIPAQELLISKHYDRFDKGVFVGVGGSFDVLSGTKKRAPKIFIKLNLEWLYRILSEPKRIKRFYKSNVKFIAKVKGMREKNED